MLSVPFPLIQLGYMDYMDPGTRTRHYKYTCPIAWGFTYADKIVPAAAGFTDVESSMEFEKSSVELSNMSCPQSTLDSNFAILLCYLCWGLYYWSDPKNYYVDSGTILWIFVHIYVA